MILTVLADENIPAVEAYFGGFATVRRAAGRTLERAQLDGVDVLLVRSVTRVDEALLRDSAVRFVGTATSGFDHIDLEYLTQHAIGFAHAPGSNANSVAEYVLAAIAAIDDQLERLLAGGSIGIIGYGVIGRVVAARFTALGIHCRVYDPWLAADTIPHCAALEEVLACDVVSLHAQLTTAQPWPSFHLLGPRELGLLRSDTLLINASRGPVIDNVALLHHLEAVPDQPVVLDVWEGEPVVRPALLDRVALGTAHIAGYSLDGKLQATRMLCDAAKQCLGLAGAAQSRNELPMAAIQAPARLAGAGLVRSLLQNRYDIVQDDALLREAVAAEPSAAPSGAGFDALRKGYRERRELAGSPVYGLESQEQRALAHALGCETVDGRAQV
ncbi:MAG: 4-phosphoerythronate dehydrogenase [Halioglobus sp.]|nr:4-phosphoerythronate dehydrogenase [Halioglobus sp.]